MRWTDTGSCVCSPFHPLSCRMTTMSALFQLSVFIRVWITLFLSHPFLTLVFSEQDFSRLLSIADQPQLPCSRPWLSSVDLILGLCLCHRAFRTAVGTCKYSVFRVLRKSLKTGRYCKYQLYCMSYIQISAYFAAFDICGRLLLPFQKAQTTAAAYK